MENFSKLQLYCINNACYYYQLGCLLSSPFEGYRLVNWAQFQGGMCFRVGMNNVVLVNVRMGNMPRDLRDINDNWNEMNSMLIPLQAQSIVRSKSSSKISFLSQWKQYQYILMMKSSSLSLLSTLYFTLYSLLYSLLSTLLSTLYSLLSTLYPLPFPSLPLISLSSPSSIKRRIVIKRYYTDNKNKLCSIRREKMYVASVTWLLQDVTREWKWKRQGEIIKQVREWVTDREEKH